MAYMLGFFSADGNMVKNKRGAHFINFEITDKDLLEEIQKVIKFPRVPEKYLSHFIRGYFDGDGSVTVGNYARKDRGNKKHKIILSGFTCGSQEFLKEIHKRVKSSSKVRGGTLYHHDGAYRLYFSTGDSLALYKFMYDKASAKLFLPRKRKKFESYFRVAQTQ